MVFLRSRNLDAGEYEAGQLDALAVIISGIASTPSDGRIGESCQGIRIVRLDSNDHSFVQQHLDPNYKSYRNRHADRVGFPVFSVNSRDFASICNYIGGSRNGGTVLAPHITDNTWIPSYPFHFIGVPSSEEFNLSVIYN